VADLNLLVNSTSGNLNRVYSLIFVCPCRLFLTDFLRLMEYSVSVLFEMFPNLLNEETCTKKLKKVLQFCF
jgi:hypothetical protein